MSVNLETIIQVSAGLLVTYVIYVIALLVLRADKMMIDETYDQNLRREVSIINGVVSSGETVGYGNRWNTVLPFSPTYLPIKSSVNRKGGAQFTYSFWVYVGQPAAAVGKTILLKGDPNVYKYDMTEKKLDIKTRQMVPKSTVQRVDRVVMCPQISFGDEEMEFVVTFNTFHNMHETLKVSRVVDDNSLFRNNITSLFSNQWVRLTVVFEDHVPINDFEDGISVKFYINEALYQTGKYASALRQNRGDLILFPDEKTIPDCKISDVRYFNYALPASEVFKLAKKPPNLTPAAASRSNAYAPLEISDYNYMDLFNR